MLFRRSTRVTIATLALLAPAVAAAPAATAESDAAAVTISYDDSQAAEYTDQITEAIGIWNDALDNVEITKSSGADADVTFIADPDWPRAELGPAMPGDDLSVWMGKIAIDEGYDVLRIAAHEFGHSLGLPDAKPGPCSSLMSGSSAGVECTNPQPNAEEIAEVESNYAGELSAETLERKGTVIVD